MKQLQKKFQIMIWVIIFLLGFYILYKGAVIAKESHFFQKFSVFVKIERALEKLAVQTHLPGLTFMWHETSSDKNWIDYALGEIVPLYTYANREVEELPEVESQIEYELLVKAEIQTEVQTETIQTEDVPEEVQTEVPETLKQPETVQRETIAEIDEEKLRDYNYLLNNFFVVDPSTTALESQINYDTLMSKNMKLSSDVQGPQILIYHTHSQEAFADSVPGDINTTIVGIGSRLAEILQDTYGYQVIHHTTVYDMIDGELDRNKAYTLAAPDIQQILDENPSIEVVIDLHRDGVDGKRFVTDINGKPTAQIMFFNGLSRTARNGEIDYLPNPYIEDNLAFSFQLHLKAEQYYPEWIRCIYLQSLRYNLHLRPRALLIESGTQLNTVEEERNAMEPLADILNQVLRGE